MPLRNVRVADRPAQAEAQRDRPRGLPQKQKANQCRNHLVLFVTLLLIWLHPFGRYVGFCSERRFLAEASGAGEPIPVVAGDELHS